jgi:hypothetical protein
MHVTYFDEVKADPKQGQDSYWVGGMRAGAVYSIASGECPARNIRGAKALASRSRIARGGAATICSQTCLGR